MRLFFLLFFSFSVAHAETAIKMDLFVSSACIHCQKAEAFFKEARAQFPWLQVNTYIINEDLTAFTLFSKRVTQFKDTNYRVPAMFFCDLHWVGFDSSEGMGKKILQALQDCRTKRQGCAKGDTKCLMK